MINFIYIILLISSLPSQDRGWVHPETGWEVIIGTHMCVFMLSDIYINNDSPESEHADAIGVFFEDQCIGWEYYNDSFVIIPTIGDDGENPQFPSDGDEISFYIYDDSEDMILSLQSLEVIPLWTLNAWPSISTLYACSYNFPINDQGECPQSCDFDPNLDGNIDILDILSLIIIILSCGDCEISCGDIIDDNEINIQDILIILEIILDD